MGSQPANTDTHACGQTAANDGQTNALVRGERAGMLAVGGSVLSALAASACCWIPLMLIAFGLSAGGASAWFEKYRWPFLGLTAVLLGIGFYFVYFRKPQCAPGSACATPSRKLQRFNRAMLWIATVVVIATAAFPKYVGYLIPESSPAVASGSIDHMTTVSLKINGMTCDACAIHVKNALVKVPGVLDASASYSAGTATISFDEGAPPLAMAVASAVETAGYQADTSSLPSGTK